jgi:hypothetical protein
MSGRRSTTRLWLLAFIGFWVLFAGWSFASPYNGSQDESQHAIRAAGVVNGEIIAPHDVNGGYQDVPRSIAAGWCFERNVDVAASCERQPGGDETVTRLNTVAARFNPVYYAVTAWPMGIWPDWHGILLSRLLNGAAVAALLACAVVASARWMRNRALIAGLAVAVTPTLAELGGAIGPQGLETAAGLALFTSLFALVHEQGDGINRATVALAAVSASVLVTPMMTGLLWLVVITGAVLLGSHRERLRELVRSATVRKWSIVVGVAVVASVAWTLLVRLGGVVTSDHHMTIGQILKTEVLDLWPNAAEQIVGGMGWANSPIPRLLFVLWYVPFGLLFVGALALGDRSDRWRTLALFLGAFAPMVLLEVLIANRTGYFTQGAYYMPGAVALPVFGAYVLARRVFTGAEVRMATRTFAVLLVPVQLVALVYTMARWNSGLVSLNPFNGSWHPPYGVVLPLVLGLLGTIGVFVTYWTASRIPVEPRHTDKEESDVRIPAEPVGVGNA